MRAKRYQVERDLFFFLGSDSTLPDEVPPAAASSQILLRWNREQAPASPGFFSSRWCPLAASSLRSFGGQQAPPTHHGARSGA